MKNVEILSKGSGNLKKIEIYSKIKGGRQDGAISNGYLFSFNHQGECTVYETEALENLKDGEAEVFF